IVLFFGLVNILGSDLVVKFQGVMVIMFLIMLSIFIITGLPHFEFKNLSPFMPNGMGSVFQAAVLGYFSFAGFISLLEFGGEIKHPTRNIPLGLGISFIIVLLSFGGVSLILSGITVEGGFQGMTTPVLEVANTFFPSWLISALVISIIAAAATTVNGLILGYSRDIFVIAEAKLFPSFLAKRSRRYKTPAYAIIAYTLLTVAAILTGSDIENYALVAVMGLLLQQLFIAVSLFRIPKVMKAEYESAEFKLKRSVINIVSVMLFIISLGFIMMMVSREPSFGLIILAVLGVGSLLYLFSSKNRRKE
ncbi:MAG: amino acid permease, partial [Kordiimonadaceae bacterium]|nr:amino acid permease [Kordiimonadaceae bacterium]